MYRDFVEKNYPLALAMLQQQLPNLPVLVTLQRGPTAYNIEKLNYLLVKHGVNPAAALPAFQPVASAPVVTAPEQEEPAVESETGAALRDELTKIGNQRKDLFKRGSFLHANQLDSDKLTDKEREAVAFEILDIYDNQIPNLDAQEKYIREHGLPASKPVKKEGALSEVNTADALAVFKRIQTLRKNISRDKIKFPDRAARYQLELDYLKQYES